MSHAYVLTAAAEADVRSIIRYTRQQWGEAQVRAYMAKLEQGIARFAHGSVSHRDMSDTHPAYGWPTLSITMFSAFSATRIRR